MSGTTQKLWSHMATQFAVQICHVQLFQLQWMGRVFGPQSTAALTDRMVAPLSIFHLKNIINKVTRPPTHFQVLFGLLELKIPVQRCSNIKRKDTKAHTEAELSMCRERCWLPQCIWLNGSCSNNGKICVLPKARVAQFWWRRTSILRQNQSWSAQGCRLPDKNLLGCGIAVTLHVMLKQSPPQRVALQEVLVPCWHRDGRQEVSSQKRLIRHHHRPVRDTVV